MVAALLAAAVIAAAPPGFYESRVLEPAASFVAGKPAHIYCALTLPRWTSYVASSDVPEGANALTIPGRAESRIEWSICRDLRQALKRRKVDDYDFVSAALILVHESIHMRGVRDEGKTECEAIHELPRTLVRYFHVKPGRQLRGLMALAWDAHYRKPDVYTSVC